jgi:hypothetical protein
MWSPALSSVSSVLLLTTNLAPEKERDVHLTKPRTCISMWSPALSSVSSVLLMAAMPLPSTSAASVPAIQTSQPHDVRMRKMYAVAGSDAAERQLMIENFQPSTMLAVNKAAFKCKLCTAARSLLCLCCMRKVPGCNAIDMRELHHTAV